MSVLTHPTLILNRNWRPIGIDTVKESIKKIMRGSCRFIDPETYEVYDVARWCEIEPKAGQDLVVGSKRTFVAPQIVLLTNYDDMPKNEIRLTRKNVLARDKYMCQYCGVKVAKIVPGSKIRMMVEYTWDHVVPKSLGGKKVWTNIVTACFKCNSRKADRLLDQCGMKLLHKPDKPKWSLSLVKNISKKPECWDKFLTKELWNPDTFVSAVGPSLGHED